MGRAERKRWSNNDRVAELLKNSESRTLLPTEIEEIRQSYTGYPNGLPTVADLLGNAAVETATVEEQQEMPTVLPEAVADNRWGQLAFGF